MELGNRSQMEGCHQRGPQAQAGGMGYIVALHPWKTFSQWAHVNLGLEGRSFVTIMAASRISKLSTLIAARTAEVDAYLTSKDLPTPSFDAHSPPQTLLDDRIAAARQDILEATDELNALMLGPAGLLTTPSVRTLLALH